MTFDSQYANWWLHFPQRFGVHKVGPESPHTSKKSDAFTIDDTVEATEVCVCVCVVVVVQMCLKSSVHKIVHHVHVSFVYSCVMKM